MKTPQHPITASMSPIQRRRFLKMLGLALAAPAIPPAVRQAAQELAIGTAHAEEAANKLPVRTKFITRHHAS